MKSKIILKQQQINKTANLLGTGEKQWGCEFLPYNCSSRNKTDKQSNQQINKQTNKEIYLP